MADFIDKLDKGVASLGRALGDVAPSGPVDFAQMLASPQSGQARSWGDILGQQRTGQNWGAMLGQQAGQGPSWMGGLQQSAQGGTNWSSLLAGGGGNKLFDLSGFDLFNSERNKRLFDEEKKRQANDPVSQPGPKLTDPAGAQGSWGAHEKYRQMYTQVAGELGLDPDEVAAFAMIETSNADPRAVSPAGAMGLWQVMPFHFKDGEDPFDPLTNTRVALRYYKQQRDKYGPGLAAAAYQGGDGAIVNGKARTDVSDGNMTPAEYEAAWRANYARIKATAPKQAPGYAGGAGGASSIWGGQEARITQEYGVVTPGIDQGIYGYGQTYGLPQGHTGWDVGVARGTQLYMPAGLTGVVETAGGTPYFLDEDYGDRGSPGKGELRIRLSNGDILILGHTSQIGVQVGQQVTGGQAVALSGSASGDHLHLEIRVRQPDGSYRLVNPGQYFGGGAGGNSGQYTP